jgi:hypothetical protein
MLRNKQRQPHRQYVFNSTRQSFLATKLRVASTFWKRLVGLLGTENSSFGAGHALWIVPCRRVHTCAMRFPIDVVYLDRANRVVHLEENVRPWRLAPVRADAQTVLELPAHTIFRSGTSIGDKLEIGIMGALKDVGAPSGRRAAPVGMNPASSSPSSSSAPPARS